MERVVIAIMLIGICFNVFAIEVTTINTKQNLSLSDVQGQLLEDWVVVKSSNEERFKLHGKSIEIAANATLIAGLNSELTFIAVLAGSATSGKIKANAGEALILGHYKDSIIRTVSFNSEDFQGRLTRLGEAGLSEVLEPVVNQQKRKLFWGLLRTTSVNLNKPFDAVYEDGRREYLLHSSLLEIKANSPNMNELLRNTADSFILGLKNENVSLVAETLSPLLFLNDRGTPYANKEWVQQRLLFAEKICERLSNKSIGQPYIDDKGLIELEIDTLTYLLELQMFDGTYFIKELRKKEL